MIEYISTYILMPNFEWDEVKNRSNIEKHLISFDEAITIFDGDVLTEVDHRGDYGEDRFLSVGKMDSDIGRVVIVVAHTERVEKTRIISARRANRKERKRYNEFVQA